MLAVYSPLTVEFLGTGDIPIDARFSWLANLYGFIPVKRGSIDRAAIYTALGVLRQGGVVGIFPQGGIWGASATQGRTGVALLGNLSAAPVVPIGFGGVRGGLEKMMKLKRPRLTMNVGKPFLLKNSPQRNLNSKVQLELDTAFVMKEIEKLIPADEFEKEIRTEEWFDVVIGTDHERDKSLFGISEADRQALGMLFHYPVLLDALARNVKLPVTSLQQIGEPHPAAEIRQALCAILNYLETINPGFFTYRFGVEAGLRVQQALKGLSKQLLEIGDQPLDLVIIPRYGYTNENGVQLEYSGINSLHPSN